MIDCSQGFMSYTETLHKVITPFVIAEQCAGVVVAVRLPDARAAWHGAAVHGALLAAHPRGARPQGHAAPAAGRRPGLRGPAPSGQRSWPPY